MLLTEIRRNQKLAAKRNPMYDRNRFAKFLIYLFTAFWAAYLILIGVTLPIAFEEGFPTMEPYDMLNACLPGFLFIDFLLRFLFPTPVQQIKPYLLLPIKKQQLINVLLVQVGLKAFNLFWLFFFVPFAGLVSVGHGLHVRGCRHCFLPECSWRFLQRERAQSQFGCQCGRAKDRKSC